MSPTLRIRGTNAVLPGGLAISNVLLGGMISVVITDLAQFVIMAVCSLIIAGIAMAKVAPQEIQALLNDR